MIIVEPKFLSTFFSSWITPSDHTGIFHMLSLLRMETQLRERLAGYSTGLRGRWAPSGPSAPQFCVPRNSIASGQSLLFRFLGLLHTNLTSQRVIYKLKFPLKISNGVSSFTATTLLVSNMKVIS